jgi:hypothetical protein
VLHLLSWLPARLKRDSAPALLCMPGLLLLLLLMLPRCSRHILPTSLLPEALLLEVHRHSPNARGVGMPERVASAPECLQSSC